MSKIWWMLDDFWPTFFRLCGIDKFRQYDWGCSTKNLFIYTWLLREKVCSFFSCSLQIRHWFVFLSIKKQIHLYMIVPWKNVQFFSCSLQIRHWFCFLSMKKQIHLYMIVPWKSVQFFLVVHFKSGIDFVFLSIKNKFIYTWLFRENMCSFLVVHFNSGIDFVFYRWKTNSFIHIYTWLFREKVCSFFKLFTSNPVG